MALEWSAVTFGVREGFWLKSKIILDKIDLKVPGGTVMGLVGPNGAGKTTTIKLGAGLLNPLSGHVLVQGRPAADPMARMCLGLLTESQYIYPHLRLKEWLNMLAGLSGLKGARCRYRVNEVLSLVELTGLENQMMNTLSKGQVQRAGLAQALVHEPDILILDEPMSGLDPYWRYRVQQMLIDFRAAGGTILFSSHILADVERISDKVSLLENGRCCWTGRLSELSRKVKGFEAICRTETPEVLRSIASEGRMEARPEGGWAVFLIENHKEELLRLAYSGTIDLESLSPVQEEIEEVLFGFGSESRKSSIKGV
jgi:ABC-2 type transport system ATP-binding protein